MTAVGRVFIDPSRNEDCKYCVCECEFVVQMTICENALLFGDDWFFYFFNVEMPFIYGYILLIIS